MIQSSSLNFGAVRLTGAVLAAFSLMMNLLILFVLPAGCSFTVAFGFIIFSFLFIIGIICFFVGQTLVWKRRKQT